MKNKDDFIIGYKKPPQDSRFRKGKSGNPKGRPKNKKTADSILIQELNRYVDMTVNGDKKKIMVKRALFRNAILKSYDDPRYLTALIRLIEIQEKLVFL